MNILVLCLSSGYGGLELYAAREVRQLNANGHQCTAVVKKGSFLDQQIRDDGLVPQYLEVTSRRLPLFAARRLARIIDEQQVDLLHIHWNNDLNLAVLAKKFSARPVKLVYSRHMAITRSKKDPLHRGFYREVDYLLAVTKVMQRQAEAFLPLPTGRIGQLYLGVADAGDEPADLQSCFDEDFPRRTLNLALFGRIEHYKGQHLLVAAVSSLVEKGMDISATIIGHVMDEDYFKEIQGSVKNQGLTGYIRFEPFVKNPGQRMKCYDAVVLTTYCETFGLVLVEAMHAGVTVIGSDCGGVPEIIDHEINGLLFSPGSADGLAEEISRLYRDPVLLANCKKQAHKKAVQEFSEHHHFVRLEEILANICNPGKGNP